MECELNIYDLGVRLFLWLQGCFQAVHKPNEDEIYFRFRNFCFSLFCLHVRYLLNENTHKVNCDKFWFQIFISIWFGFEFASVPTAVFLFLLFWSNCLGVYNESSAQFTLDGNNSLAIIIDHILDGAKEGTHCEIIWLFWLFYPSIFVSLPLVRFLGNHLEERLGVWQ